MLLEIPICLVLFLAYADPVPDYDSPYSPIYTDKPVYSWTDKIRMKIIAPSWNENRHAIDTIGDTDEHPIRISTRGKYLEPYRFTETGANSGIFTAEVNLTGFPHDVNGDGSFDTMPRTMGNGPAGGFLEAERGSAVTISFEFAKGVIVSKSVPIRWNAGTIHFSEDEYVLGDMARLTVADPDMNLNSQIVDRAQVLVSSDSDAAGIRLNVIETGVDSGVFVGQMSFTQHVTVGTRLHALPGDDIHARYHDHTLPEPHSVSDSLVVHDAARLGAPAPAMGHVESHGIWFADSSGDAMTAFLPGSQIQIVGMLENTQEFPQPFVFIIQIRDERDHVTHLSWIQGEIAIGQDIGVSQSWIPKNSGTYTVETFVWDSLSGLVPLAPFKTAPVYVR